MKTKNGTAKTATALGLPRTVQIKVSVLAKATTNKTDQKTDQTTTKNGDVITDKKTNAIYKVANGALIYAGTKNANAATVTIPATYKLNDVTYKVTSIADNAFKGTAKNVKVTVPKKSSQ